MIEYIYNAIKATAGEDITIAASITNSDEEAITANCSLSLFDDNDLVVSVVGLYSDGLWNFIIPAASTKGLHGRYWYTINNSGVSISFKEPIYLM